MRPRSLYIHVPFCARRCSYCDFAVDAVREPPVGEWIEAVVSEMTLTMAARDWGSPLQLDTLYVGGGTPSLLGTGAMQSLVKRLEPFAGLASGAEWTCEANPESFSPALAADWRRSGVNRISLGAQTFSPEALRWMGRLHGPDGPGRAFEAAREAGIDDIGIDLIFGLPAHLDRDWKADLERALALDPTHVSLYGLTAEAGAPLGRWVAEGRETLADEDRYADEYLLAHEVLSAAGFDHYEVSNFARPGRRSRHNSVYWTGAPYAALGPGAHSFDPPTRRWNLRSWAAYRDTLAAGRLPMEGDETVDESATSMEQVWLRLRTSEGIVMDSLPHAASDMIDGWMRRGHAVAGEGTLRLTPEGWLLLDRLALDLSEALLPESALPQGRIDGARPLVQISGTSNP